MKLFLDTNIYLHYHYFLAIPWPELAGSQDVTIVVPSVVTRELDKYKNTGDNAARRERARKALTGITDALQAGGRATDRLFVERFVPGAEVITKLRLDPNWADHQLLAAIVDYQAKHLSEGVLLVSGDTNIRLDAQDQGIQVLVMPEKFRLDDADETKRELRALKLELAKRDAAAPDLEVTFQGGSNLLVHPFADPPALQQADLDALRRRLREEYRHVDLGTPGYVLSSHEAERHHNNVAKYIENYVEYSQKQREYERRLVRQIPLELFLINSGASPAQTIEIELEVPENVLVVPEGFSRPKKPRAPSLRPEKMVPNHMDQIRSHIASIRNIPSVAEQLRQKIHGPSIQFSTGLVSFSVTAINPDKTERLGVVHCSPNGDPPRSFGIDYVIHAAGLPSRKTGRLNVRIDPQKWDGPPSFESLA